MINLDKKEINFLGHRKVFLIIAAMLVALSAILLCTKGLNLSTEFVGGSTITYLNAQEGTDEQSVREAIEGAGYDGSVQVQTMSSNGVDGFLARIDSTDVQQTESWAMSAAGTLGVADGDVQVSTIGPNWGASVVQSMVIAALVAVLCVLCYIAIRFRDIKVGISAVIDMCFDVAVTFGILSFISFFYDLTLSPAVISSILLVASYSCYDVVVLMRSLKDTEASVKKQGYFTIANHAINQVLTRSINTTLTTLVPVLMMLILGGATLTDFAIVILVGMLVGACSTIMVAMPVYTIWSSHDLQPAKLNAKYGMGINTDTEAIMGYEKGVDDIPVYLEKRQTALASTGE